ncbi:MAG: hypothetical protein AAF697_01930 [Pseudomonadota bacterium]
MRALVLSSFFLLFLAFSSSAARADLGAFVHVVERGATLSSGAYTTTIDHPLINNKPEAALQVAYQGRDGEARSTARPVSVWYSDGRWKLRSLNNNAFQAGERFSIISVPRDRPGSYIHQNRNRGNILVNLPENTRLRHPQLDGNPNAQILVTNHTASIRGRLVSNSASPAVYYRQGYWHIRNIDGSEIPDNAVFNVYFGEDVEHTLQRQELVRAAGGLRSVFVPDTATRPATIATFTDRFTDRESQYRGSVITPKPYFSWVNQRSLRISPNDGSLLPTSLSFNTLAYRPYSSFGPRYRVYIADRYGSRRQYLDTPILMFDPSLEGNGRLARISGLDYDGANQLTFNETAINASTETTFSELAYVHEDGRSISKFMTNAAGENVGLFTVADGLIAVARIDLDGDGVVDYMEVADAVNRRITTLVLESPENLEALQELGAGRGYLCAAGMKSLSSGSGGEGSAIPLGVGVPGEATMDSCSKGSPPFANRIGSRPLPTNANDNFDAALVQWCSGVLSANPNWRGGNELVSFDSVLSGMRTIFSGVGMVGMGIVAAAGGVAAAPIAAGIGAGLAIGSGIVIIGTAAAEFIEDSRGGGQDAGGSTREPLPDAQVDGRVAFCAAVNRAANAPSIEDQEAAYEEGDCGNPLENVVGISGYANSASRPTPGEINERVFCPNKVQHADLESMWSDLQEERCSSRIADPNPDSSRNVCNVGGAATPSGRLQIAAADIIAPAATAEINRILDQVVNPGIRFDRLNIEIGDGPAR